MEQEKLLGLAGRMHPDNLFDFVKSLTQPLPDSIYDNGLNIRCSVCNGWVSKRIAKDGKCPSCN